MPRTSLLKDQIIAGRYGRPLAAALYLCNELEKENNSLRTDGIPPESIPKPISNPSWHSPGPVFQWIILAVSMSIGIWFGGFATGYTTYSDCYSRGHTVISSFMLKDKELKLTCQIEKGSDDNQQESKQVPKSSPKDSR